jgi:6-pyruvoyl-tetrahydropterin synthase
LTVAIEGSVNNETGMVADYAWIKESVQPLIEMLDHHHLGQGKAPYGWFETHDLYCDKHLVNLEFPMLPTSENILLWIAEQLNERKFKFSSLRLNETCTSECELTWDEFLWYQTTKGGARADTEAESAEGQEASAGSQEAEAPEALDSTLISDDDIPF